MSLAPLPNAPGVFRVTEVIAVGRLAQPLALAGQFAGVSASRFAAVALALLVTVIGEEKLAATVALASPGLETHRESKPPRRRRELKQNSRREEGPARKKEEGFLREVSEEKPTEENAISNRRV